MRFAGQWFAGEDLRDIESAAGEALANSAEHGAADGTTIDVTCRCDGVIFTIEIEDAGGGFERWNAGACGRPHAGSSRGFGTFIMRELMDEIEYTKRGARVRLVKRLVAR